MSTTAASSVMNVDAAHERKEHTVGLLKKEFKVEKVARLPAHLNVKNPNAVAALGVNWRGVGTAYLTPAGRTPRKICHEQVHHEQWWRLPYIHPVLYQFCWRYRLACEVEAYATEVHEHAHPLLGQETELMLAEDCIKRDYQIPARAHGTIKPKLKQAIQRVAIKAAAKAQAETKGQ